MSTFDAVRLEPAAPEDPSPHTSVLDRWDEVVAQAGQRRAVVADGASYTFEALDGMSEHLAAVLSSPDSEPSDPVGVLLGHTPEAIIALLAAAKAGRPFVVLDPHLPVERLRDFAALAGIDTLVADARTAAAADEIGADELRLIRIEDALAEALAQPTRLPRPQSGLADALGIVFTSGSTGRPKGVVQTHGLMLNDTLVHTRQFGVTEHDRIALVLPLGFAAGLSACVCALLLGAEQWMYDPRDDGTRGALDLVRREKLTALYCSPHLMRSICALDPAPGDLASLRMLATVGEAVTGRDVLLARRYLPATSSYYNWCGSSEIGTLAVHRVDAADEVPATVIPAGRVAPNRTVRLLDEHGNQVPDGEVGELIVASHFLSGGYWRDPELHAARFGVDETGMPFVRQGDLARIDENGDLVLIGRADDAVKVRGYLVEPREIEAALLDIPGVQDAAVIALVDPPAPTRLLGYAATTPGERPPSIAAIRRALRERLPEYMVPGSLMLVPELPRNERGKVDRVRLPKIPAPIESPAELEPRERAMADVWCQILGLPQVGPDADFMALGGDSLCAEQLFTIAEERFGVRVTSTDLLSAPTLREFTARVTHAAKALPRHPDVLALNSEATGTPVFCFAGSGALAMTFVPLSRHFPASPFYAFQAHGLERRAVPDWSVGAAARRYLPLIRLVRPRGPYRLVGHSFGGLVALEIARLLTDAGEEVEFTAILDTYLPSGYATAPQPPLLGTSAGASPARRDPRPTRGALPGWARLSRLLPDGLPAPDQWPRRARAYLAGVVQHEGQRQFDVMFDHGVLASRTYSMPSYAGRALLVLADDNPDGPAPWASVLTGPHEVVELASEHTSLLREPHVSRVAELLSQHLG